MTHAIRSLTLSEVETLIGWAGAEGWNPGIGDAEAFRAVDPEGFLGAFAEGELAAGIAAVAYDEAFGFIGLYICHPRHRGKGLGRAVWDAGLARLGSRTVGLDGVAEQQANYRAMGFVPAYGTQRFAGRLRCAEADAGWTVEPFRAEHLEAVAALDRRGFPADRRRFLLRWLRPPHRAMVALRGGALGGCGVLRPCLSGSKVGPLLATDDSAAGAILCALAGAADGATSIDVPDRQAAFSRMLPTSGLMPEFRTARMYRNAAAASQTRSVFGVTSLELG